MEEFVCNLLAITKDDLLWLQMLNQKYNVLDEQTSIFDRFLETETGNDDPSSIIYDNCLDPYLAETAMLTAIIRNEVNEDFELKSDINTVDELLLATNNGTEPLNAFYYYTDIDQSTLKKFSTLIMELNSLHTKFKNLASFSKSNNTTFKYASKTRRR